MPYVATTWASGDEITSAKLQTMSQNDAYFNENMVYGNLNFLPGTGGVAPAGRTIGTETATKIEALRYDFDSLTETQVYVLRIDLPPVFTVPPIVVFSYNVSSYFTIVHLSEGDRTDYIEFYMAEKDSQYVRFQGKIQAILLGA